MWFLLAKGANPNGANIPGYATPLIAAIKSKMFPIMDILFAYGANASLFHSQALREIDTESYKLQQELARKLLQHGANPDAADPHSDNQVMRKTSNAHNALYNI